MLTFDKISIYLPENSSELSRTAGQVFREEILRRIGVQFLESSIEDANVIFCTEQDAPEDVDNLLEHLQKPGCEGYRLLVSSCGKGRAIVEGADSRGLFYGMGKLLRLMDWSHGVSFPETALSSTPASSLRGHQLGYRPKTNAYDAWTLEIYDRYLRELALFGANAVELLPPRTDDDLTGPLMTTDPLEMIGILSEKAHHYGMDVWVWYPNMEADIFDEGKAQAELLERREVFCKMPYLDHLFIPGGDPGDLDPADLFSWSGRVAQVLHESHPDAGVWLSPQTFNPSRGWTDAFYAQVEKKPEWLTGVVFGPWEKDPSDEMRRRIPAEYPLRNYPDVGHSFRCQFPVEMWDIAFALTEGREVINPRPNAEKLIQNEYRRSFTGSIGYSEGINDDVNKFVWLGQEWDPESSAIDTLRDYARLFIDCAQADDIAQGIMALEDNFRGPVAANSQIEVCLSQWQEMENRLCPYGKRNYRFEMGLIRAYYDCYQRERLIFETYLEQQAKHELRRAPSLGSKNAISSAINILRRAEQECVCPEYRQRIEELADALFEDIGMQLTVSRHQALHWGRGGFVECIDIPLNDSRFLIHRLNEIAAAAKPVEILASANPSAPDDKKGTTYDSNEAYRLTLISELLNRNNPGPGGKYDDMGDWSSFRRVTNICDYSHDPAFLHGALRSFVMQPPHPEQDTFHLPLAWQQHACAMYMTPLEVRYDNLDPDSRYLLRVTYLGYFGQHARLTAKPGIVIHDTIALDRKIMTMDFELPQDSYASGTLELSFTGYDGERGISVAEISLLKQPHKL